MCKEVVLSTEKLTKKYGNITTVNSVDLHVKKGRIYGLLGRNGAGKTTIMKMILGLTTISDGRVQIFGEDLYGNQEKIYPQIGSIIEVPGFYGNLTASENLEIFARLRGSVNKKRIMEVLSVVGLEKEKSKTFASYSLGMKQRLGIANALMNDPKILILDEPTNGLDPIGIAEMRELLIRLCHEEGKTLIISSHILSEMALLADDIGIINKGALLEECTLQELQKKAEQYILIRTSKQYLAEKTLKNKLGVERMERAADGGIRIYDLSKTIEEVGLCLYKNNLPLSHLELCADNLENYFKKTTGGVGIA